MFYCYITDVGKIRRGYSCTGGYGEESGNGRVDVGSYSSIPIWTTKGSTFSKVVEMFYSVFVGDLRFVYCTSIYFLYFLSREALTGKWKRLDYFEMKMKRNDFCRSSRPDSPAQNHQEQTQEIPARKISLLSRPFGLGWRERNKVS